MIDEAVVFLRKRVDDADRPTRERMYAAAVLHRDDAAFVHRCISAAHEPAFEFLGRLLRLQESTGDTIETILLSETIPETLPEMRLVDEAAMSPAREKGVTYLDSLPPTIQTAALRYLRYALLSPEGTYRRQAALAPAEMPACVARQVTRPIRNREARSRSHL